MNPVLQNILDRHSCRSFTEQPVESEKLQDLLTAAVWAPSGRNEQSWHFTLLANTEKIQALAAAVREADNRPARLQLFRTGCLSHRIRRTRQPQQLSRCRRGNENVLLTATSLGLGTCWINQVRDVCDVPAVRALLTEYGVPESHIVNASAAIGYPAAQPVIHERKANTTTLVR